MANDKIKISIVTVCFNAVDTIEDTMLSVLNQTYDLVEYIIIDGGSTDGTVDKIKKYSNQLAYWISEQDKGIYDAMNKGIKIATGDYINFMNAGDKFVSSEVIDLVAKQIISIPNTDVFFGLTKYEKNGLIKDALNLKPFIYSNRRFKQMGICHQSIFTEIRLAKTIMFDTSFRIAADYNMMMKIFNNKGSFVDLKIPISIFNINGISCNNWEERDREVAVINGFKSDGIVVNYLIFIKKLKSKIKPFLMCKLHR